jgi:DNA repair protein RadD
MSHVWSVFGQDELQKLIGIEILERLNLLVPALRVADANPTDVFQKQVLCEVFDAFVGPDAMKELAFRRNFYNHLSPSTMDALGEVAGIPADHKFAVKVSELAARGWSDPALSSSIAKILGLSSAFMPIEQYQYPGKSVLSPPDRPLKPLKDYQVSVYMEAVERVQVHCARFVVQMPTGSGKTRTAMELVANILNEAGPFETVVWLAHSSELCEQAYECFVDVWSHLGKHPLQLSKAWGTEIDLPYNSPHRSFVIAGFQKLYSLVAANNPALAELKKRVHTIVVDEAHRVLAPTYSTVTKSLMGTDTRIVGLTATPGRSTVDGDENEALAEFFFNQMISIDAGESSVIEYLRSRGVLAHAQYAPLTTSRAVTLTAAQEKALAEFFEFPESILKKLGADDIRNVEIVRRLERECTGGGNILFFACSVEHSRFICALLIFLGIRAAHVDGGTSPGRRQQTVHEFRNGGLQVLCNYGVLSTGFDAPKVNVVFISRPTASIVLYSQMIGRGLRGPAIGGTEFCKVIDVRDNIIGFSDQDHVYTYFDEYFDKTG